MPVVSSRSTVPSKPSSAITTLLPPARTSSGSPAASASATASIASDSVRASTMRFAGPPRRRVVSGARSSMAGGAYAAAESSFRCDDVDVAADAQADRLAGGFRRGSAAGAVRGESGWPANAPGQALDLADRRRAVRHRRALRRRAGPPARGDRGAADLLGGGGGDDEAGGRQRVDRALRAGRAGGDARGAERLRLVSEPLRLRGGLPPAASEQRQEEEEDVHDVQEDARRDRHRLVHVRAAQAVE